MSSTPGPVLERPLHVGHQAGQREALRLAALQHFLDQGRACGPGRSGRRAGRRPPSGAPPAARAPRPRRRRCPPPRAAAGAPGGARDRRCGRPCRRCSKPSLMKGSRTRYSSSLLLKNAQTWRLRSSTAPASLTPSVVMASLLVAESLAKVLLASYAKPMQRSSSRRGTRVPPRSLPAAITPPQSARPPSAVRRRGARGRCCTVIAPEAKGASTAAAGPPGGLAPCAFVTSCSPRVGSPLSR